jgi:hypothetical protein
MNLFEKHHASIQKSNNEPINPPLNKNHILARGVPTRGIPPLKELKQLLKTSKRIN